MANARLLIVDDDKLLRWSLRERLQDAGYETLEAGTLREAEARLGEGVDMVLLDQRLPDGSGLELLRKIRKHEPELPILMMTGHSSVEQAVEAMREGAYHYARKPLNLDEMSMLVSRALEASRLRREVHSLRTRNHAPFTFDAIIGESPAMRQAKALLEKVARTPASTILITGESGTGKDLAAKAVHYNSDRAGAPLMNITCSALQETLLESELFGHEKGAFTDARTRKKGLLELADGGTVFLDEIGEMTPNLQAKILRFLEDKVFRRVGGVADIRVNVRIVAATNRDLGALVRKGSFREDLFYRLRVLPIALPPLRERTGDVPLLVEHYIATYEREFRKTVRGLTPGAMQLLEDHPWPGNVRELRNAIERAVLVSEADRLDVEDFQMLSSEARAASTRFLLPPAGVDFEALERDLVVQALERTAGNQTQAAVLLNMTRDQVRYRVERFGLEALARHGDHHGPH